MEKNFGKNYLVVKLLFASFFSRLYLFNENTLLKIKKEIYYNCPLL